MIKFSRNIGFVLVVLLSVSCGFKNDPVPINGEAELSTAEPKIFYFGNTLRISVQILTPLKNEPKGELYSIRTNAECISCGYVRTKIADSVFEGDNLVFEFEKTNTDIFFETVILPGETNGRTFRLNPPLAPAQFLSGKPRIVSKDIEESGDKLLTWSFNDIGSDEQSLKADAGSSYYNFTVNLYRDGRMIAEIPYDNLRTVVREPGVYYIRVKDENGNFSEKSESVTVQTEQ